MFDVCNTKKLPNMYMYIVYLSLGGSSMCLSKHRCLYTDMTLTHCVIVMVVRKCATQTLTTLGRHTVASFDVLM